MPTLRLGKHVLKSGEKEQENCTKKSEPAWLQMPPVTRLFSKRDEAGCALRPGLPDLNGPRNEIPSVERLVPRLQHPVEHQGPDGQACRSKRVPEEFPEGHGTFSLGVHFWHSCAARFVPLDCSLSLPSIRVRSGRTSGVVLRFLCIESIFLSTPPIVAPVPVNMALFCTKAWPVAMDVHRGLNCVPCVFC